MEKAKILVVEDQNIVALNIRNKLMNLGYTVPSTAASGEEAIRKTELTGSDLVLMDIMLKGDMDGIEAAREIKSRFGIPVLYLTAYTDSETLERAKMTEPSGYISKPFKEEDLHSNIEMALHKNRARKEGEEGKENAQEKTG
ncbi:response regulator [Methanosarcina sp. KYL-1]|uniref:response regulator n=1 Tax=Methanosarcina sp. KYL-1 TaxID=2602068 RepID=UPI002100C206|nr:response regulator [Methanosarcina sp. KYL-1]MCQ1536743.1 response regulator [Methanosarcina sp. KYL-1]